MPYNRTAELPSALKKLPPRAKRIFRRAFNNAYDHYDSEDVAFRVAWSAVKRLYKKRGDAWVAKKGNGRRISSSSSEDSDYY
ncbi:ChaB-like [Operophtera brumata nucleopolyhedrovirus]|uniref:ChaB-like n=1 Tax=Operophtera brumata nucleopolyhedrovirus TaxID=1046267 RepID=A0A2H4UZS8_9ABAC|nr:ChaB-like [Operophtera brumata nucleopolyhedrovirus]AUA60280.1 ChaB-like [Operophtera brumata nucleopolyhedrovirus]